MTTEYQRGPIPIATIENDNIIWKFEVLHDVLSRANGNNIRIVIVIGRYQIGKTTFILTVTRNQNHIIGDGEHEQTSGATIDGPYSIEELMQGRENREGQQFPRNESIFFVDIEGFDGQLRGNQNQQHRFFSKLCVPFVAISSCIVYMCDLNENQASIDQLITTLWFRDFTVNNIENNTLTSPIVLVNLLRNIRKYMQIDYSNPELTNYQDISHRLTENWRIDNFRNRPFLHFTKPLPFFFTNDNLYNVGINLILNDLLRITTIQNVRYTTNNPNRICDFFTSVCNSVESFDRNHVTSEYHIFHIQLISDDIRQKFEHINEINDAISLISENIINDPEFNDLNRNRIAENLRPRVQTIVDKFISNNIDAKYFQIPEVKDIINANRNNILLLIDKKTKEIIINKIRIMLSNEMIEINNVIERNKNEMINNHDYNTLFLEIIINDLTARVCFVYNQFINNNIPIEHQQIQEVDQKIITNRNFINSSIIRESRIILISNIQQFINSLNNLINNNITIYTNEIINDHNYNELVLTNIYQNLRNRTSEIYNQEVNANIRNEYQRFPEVRDMIIQITRNINTLLNSKSIIILVSKIRSILDNSFENIKENISQYSRDLLTHQNLIREYISESLTLLAITIFNGTINDRISIENQQIEEISNLIQEYRRNVESLIQNKTTEILNIQNAKNYKNRIVEAIRSRIQYKVDELRGTKILKYIPEDCNFVYLSFYHLFVNISDSIFNRYVSDNNYHHITYMNTIILNMHDEIGEIIEKILPDIMIRMHRKKNLQIFVKVLMGFGIGLGSTALLSVPAVGGGLAAAVAAGATSAAVTGVFGGIAASSFASTLSNTGAMVSLVPQIHKLFNDTDLDHLNQIFNARDHDFEIILREIEEIEAQENNGLNEYEDQDESEDEDGIRINDIN